MKKKKQLAKTNNKTPTAKTQSALTAQVVELAEVLRSQELSEIEVEEKGVRIRVARSSGGVSYVAQAPVASAAPVAAAAPGPAARTETETSDGNTSYIVSPFVGTFYRAPGPDTAPFVDVGTRVKKGQVICIVEAMKLMNEIESEVDGVVAQILIENGQAVEYGEPLFKSKQ